MPSIPEIFQSGLQEHDANKIQREEEKQKQLKLKFSDSIVIVDMDLSFIDLFLMNKQEQDKNRIAWLEWVEENKCPQEQQRQMKPRSFVQNQNTLQQQPKQNQQRQVQQHPSSWVPLTNQPELPPSSTTNDVCV